MKRRSTLPYVLPQLTKQRGLSAGRALYEQLRDGILSGQLAPGTRLPSTRTLAEELEVSRNTVAAAFEQLVIEGYLVSKVGDGSYVSSTLPEQLLKAPAAGRREAILGRATISKAATHAQASAGGVPERGEAARPFRPSLPAFDHFPIELWAKITAQLWRSAPASLLGYGAGAGYEPLRKSIAQYLSEFRGLHCDWRQVIVTSGSQQAIHISAATLLDPGAPAAMEEPGYRAARSVFQLLGARVSPIEVDGEGISVKALQRLQRSPKVVYVTPSYQYPLGVTMSLARRLELIEWAERNSCWIIEDDYDAEFRYTGRPIPALQGLDGSGRVVYVGTFSKVLLPSLRLGYLVVPESLIEPINAMRVNWGHNAQLIDQAVVHRFIEEGHFHRHVRQMRMLYSERQAVLVESVARELGGLLHVAAAPGGMHLPAFLPKQIDAHRLAQRGAEAKLTLVPLSRFASKPLATDGLLLGYTSFTPRQLREGVRTLAGLLPHR